MVRIGIIGVGGVADGAHIPQLAESDGGVLKAICDINEERLCLIGDKYNIPEKYRFTNYIDLISCDEVDAVEICTPNYLHAPIAAAALKAGKPVNVEKPLALDCADAEPLKELPQLSSVKNMMCFSYRFKPAVRYAKEIIDKGMLGDILNVNVEYLKSSAFCKDRRLEWRFIKKYAGTGVLGDLGAHLVDMAEFLVGDFESVCAKAGIIVKERKKLDSEEIGRVETDDYCNFMVNFKNGAAGMFAITRCAIGHSNTIKYDIYGTKGVLSFDLNNPDILNVCLGEVDTESCGMHTVKVPSRFGITQEQMFVDLASGKPCEYLPTIKDGLRCQQILDSLLLSSEKEEWIKI